MTELGGGQRLRRRPVTLLLKLMFFLFLLLFHSSSTRCCRFVGDSAMATQVHHSPPSTSSDFLTGMAHGRSHLVNTVGRLYCSSPCSDFANLTPHLLSLSSTSVASLCIILQNTEAMNFFSRSDFGFPLRIIKKPRSRHLSWLLSQIDQELLSQCQAHLALRTIIGRSCTFSLFNPIQRLSIVIRSLDWVLFLASVTMVIPTLLLRRKLRFILAFLLVICSVLYREANSPTRKSQSQLCYWFYTYVLGVSFTRASMTSLSSINFATWPLVEIGTPTKHKFSSGCMLEAASSQPLQSMIGTSTEHKLSSGFMLQAIYH